MLGFVFVMEVDGLLVEVDLLVLVFWGLWWVDEDVYGDLFIGVGKGVLV